MDITIDIEDYKLNIRSAAIIIHNNKLLVHKNINSDHYVLVGGRVQIGETSEETVKREVLEEIGKEINITGYYATIENFFESKGSKYHEILFIYQAEFVNKEDQLIEDEIKNKERKDYLIYKWIDLDKIDSYIIKPEITKEILKEKIFPIHKIYYNL